MYSRPYMTNYNPSASQQSLTEQIDNEIERLKQMKTQISQPVPAINQTFQLAPNNGGMRYANTLDEVNKEIVYIDTPFFSKDMSVLWLKNNKGEIKTYELKEIIQKDEKDLKIDYLMAQIEDLKKGMIKNESNVNVNEPIADTIESKEPSNVPTISKPSKKSK